MDLNLQMKNFILGLPKPIISSKIEFRKSNINGNGVFAKETIGKGEILVVEQGIEVDGSFVEIFETIGFHTNLCIGWNQYILHAPLTENSTGYLNHSCDPNIGMANDRTMVSIRTIVVGEEITIDYGMFETAKNWTMQCNCSSEKCRGTITGRDFLRLRENQILKNYLSPYLKNEIAEGVCDEPDHEAFIKHFSTLKGHI